MTDSIPWYIAVPLAVVLWIAYVIVVRVQSSREKR